MRSQINSLVEELLRLCPSDAAFRAYFGQRASGVLAEIHVVSQSTSLSASHHGCDLLSALRGLKIAMMGQIAGWRRQRFAS